MKKILLLYGESYSRMGMNSLADIISDYHYRVDLTKDPLEALKNIKNYHLLIMGLLWSPNETKQILDKSPYPKNTLDIIDLYKIGIQVYQHLQKAHPIKTIILDSTLYPQDFCRKNNLLFLRLPEKPEILVDLIKKETF